jgi:ABC-type Na+ efflux pump permease subunit
MRRAGLIARREFLAAVTNRGFVIGLLLMPLLAAAFAVVFPRLLGPGTAPVRGAIAVIDPTGLVAPAVHEAFAAPAVNARRDAEAREALRRAPSAAVQIAGSEEILRTATGPRADVTVLDRPGDADPEAERAWLVEEDSGMPRLAVVVIHRNAVEPGADGTLGTYDLYVPASMNNRAEGVVHGGIYEAIVTARARTRNMAREQALAMTRVPRPTSITVRGDRAGPTSAGFNTVLPIAFVGLLVFGVMVGGQTLLTNTIEEKSSRVVEVLLSAVSPLELMAGKILGQLGVSLLVLFVYLGIGIVLLLSFALAGLLDPILVIYLLVFFLINYALFASVFAAAGAAVNDLKEAQALMGPIMLVLMGPWVVAFPISRDPDSTLAVVLSFVPPVNSFVMMIRLSSVTPPPFWQALISILIGIASAALAVWFAAKVFRIGLLMHGKPPNLRTLFRWVREA